MRYSEEFISSLEEAFVYEFESISSISARTSVAINTLYRWKKSYNWVRKKSVFRRYVDRVLQEQHAISLAKWISDMDKGLAIAAGKALKDLGLSDIPPEYKDAELRLESAKQCMDVLIRATRERRAVGKLILDATKGDIDKVSIAHLSLSYRGREPDEAGKKTLAKLRSKYFTLQSGGREVFELPEGSIIAGKED